MYGKERILVLLGIEFSDDFDPNNSIKSNRQSIWMKCLTISPLCKNIHSMYNTFPISFGLKDKSHEIIENKFMDELTELSDPKKKTYFIPRSLIETLESTSKY